MHSNPHYETASKIEVIHLPKSDNTESKEKTKQINTVRLELLYYSQSVKRVLKITDPVIQNKLGVQRRTILSPISLDIVEKDYFTFAQSKLLETAIEQEKMEVLDTSFIPAKLSESKQTPQVEIDKNNKSKPTKQIESHFGELVEHGWGERTINDKIINAYYVDIKQNENQAVKRIWGNDLNRAISESKAYSHNYIQIISHGYKNVYYSQTPSGTKVKLNKPRKMKVYEIKLC